MQGKHLFEYSIIRFVPRVEREEFLNVGVIVYCSSQGFLETVFEIDNLRLLTFFKKTDLTELEQRLVAFQKVCAGGKHGGPIGKLPMAGRFRWLTANRSTIIQTSPTHPGFCQDPKQMLKHLFDTLVKQVE